MTFMQLIISTYVSINNSTGLGNKGGGSSVVKVLLYITPWKVPGLNSNITKLPLEQGPEPLAA